MKKWMLTCGVMLLGWANVSACDACGCGVNAGDPGLLMQQQAHFLGWVTSYQAFVYPESATRDYFLQSELWARWAMSPRWSFTGRVPFHIHRRVDADGTVADLSGLGDLRAQIRYLAFQTQDTSRNKQILFLQSEWRMPTSTLTQGGNTELPFRFFPGQAQWTHRISAVHIARLGTSWSLTSEAALGYSWNQDLSYRLGTQVGLSSIVARHWDLDMSRLSLWAGASLSTQARDVERGYYRNDTGGEGLNGMAGLQWEGRKWNLGLQAQAPLWQHFGEESFRGLPSSQLVVQYRL